jgi:AraC family transcriptional regulator, transcriptional activator of pobA
LPGKIPSYSFSKTLGKHSFQCTELEKSYQSYDASHPHRHKYYELLWFKGSGGQHEIDFIAYEIKEETFHLVLPGQVHHLRRNPDVTGFVISFTDDLFIEHAGKAASDQFFILNDPLPVLVPVEDQRSRISIQLEELLKERNAEDQRTAYHLISMLLIQLEKIRFNSQGAIQQKGNTISIDFRKLLEKHFLKRMTVAQYAELLNITPGHLNDTVNKMTGKSASEMIHERMILEAKRLLYHSTDSVKEIAAQLAFEDPSYFTRFFRTQVMMTPEEFRKSIREKHQ